MNREIAELKQSLIKDMTDYMNFGGAEDERDPDYDPDFDAGYTQEHIDRCGEIIDHHLSALAKAPDAGRHQYIMNAVKAAVLELNKLNEECEGGLIETDQREQLCELITVAANQAGLVSDEEDITGEWREW
ncbi:hypothetical protein [Methylomagnum sp.]